MNKIVKFCKWWSKSQINEVQASRFTMLYIFAFCFFATFYLVKYIPFNSWLWWVTMIAFIMGISEMVWFIVRHTEKVKETKCLKK